MAQSANAEAQFERIARLVIKDLKMAEYVIASTAKGFSSPPHIARHIPHILAYNECGTVVIEVVTAIHHESIDQRRRVQAFASTSGIAFHVALPVSIHEETMKIFKSWRVGSISKWWAVPSEGIPGLD